MLRKVFTLCLLSWLVGCLPKGGNEQPQTSAIAHKDSTPQPKNGEEEKEPADSLTPEEVSDYAWYHIVIVDTSDRYDKLMDELRTVETRNGLKVDLMGRYFDKKKQAIILPENDEDELYAGSYFPRRYPGNTLSIEYMNAFTPQAGNKTMALVARIAEKKKDADSLMNVLKANHSNTHIITSKVFIGCMH
jgi:hypothetical protein